VALFNGQRLMVIETILGFLGYRFCSAKVSQFIQCGPVGFLAVGKL
jgi:hypothetical protein